MHEATCQCGVSSGGGSIHILYLRGKKTETTWKTTLLLQCIELYNQGNAAELSKVKVHNETVTLDHYYYYSCIHLKTGFFSTVVLDWG